MDTIKVMVVGPTAKLDVLEVRNHFQNFNHLVGDGSITGLLLPPVLMVRGFYAYCDDDAIEREQDANAYAMHFGKHVLRGPVVMFRDDGEGGEISLTTDDVTYLEAYFRARPDDEALELTARDQAWWNRYPSGIRIVESDR